MRDDKHTNEYHDCWTDGVAIMESLGCRNARSAIGMLCKRVGAKKLWPVLKSMEGKDIREPVSYAIGALKQEG